MNLSMIYIHAACTCEAPTFVQLNFIDDYMCYFYDVFNM